MDGASSYENPEEEDEEEEPDVTCLRPASGGINNPACECFGSVTLRVLSRQGRW